MVLLSLLVASVAHAGFPDSSHMCLFIGQSNTEAYKALPLVDGEPTTPLGGTMFSVGPRIFPNGGGNYTPLDTGSLGPIVPIHEMYAPGYVAGWALGNTAATAFASSMAASGYPVLVAAVGLAGTPYAGLQKGTMIYENSLAVVREAVKREPGLWVDCIVAMEGETDALNGTPQAVFEADMLAWEADYASDIAAITAQTRPPLFLSQETTTSSTPDVGLAQVASSWADFDIRIVGPLYNFHFQTDGFHIDAPSHHRFGELAARAFKGWLGLGPSVNPALQAYSADRVGAPIGTGTEATNLAVRDNEIQVNYYVPSGSIRWLPGAATHPVNRGFLYINPDGTVDPITAVSILGPKNLILSLAHAPEAGGTLRYGWDTLGVQESGGQGIVADTQWGLSTYDGSPLYDVALATETTVP